MIQCIFSEYMNKAQAMREGEARGIHIYLKVYKVR